MRKSYEINDPKKIQAEIDRLDRQIVDGTLKISNKKKKPSQAPVPAGMSTATPEQDLRLHIYI